MSKDKKTPAPKKTASPRIARTGAWVKYCGHDAMFVADVFEIEGAVAIYANGDIEKSLVRPATAEATHHVEDFPQAGMWKPRRGVLVVPKDQVKVLR